MEQQQKKQRETEGGRGNKFWDTRISYKKGPKPWQLNLCGSEKFRDI